MFQSITFNAARDVHIDDPFAYACKLPAIKSRKGCFEFKPGLNVIVGHPYDCPSHDGPSIRQECCHRDGSEGV